MSASAVAANEDSREDADWAAGARSWRVAAVRGVGVVVRLRWWGAGTTVTVKWRSVR